MSMKHFVGGLFTVLAAGPAFASGLFTPYSMSSAAVLPKGVKRVGYSGFTTEISNEYSNRGGVEVLGADFNKQLKVGELVKATPAGKSRGIFKGGLEANGVSMDETAGMANGWIDARVTTSVPTLAYGLSDRWTLAVGVPIVYSNMHPAIGWTVDPQFEAKLNKLAGNGYRNTLSQYEGDLNNVIQTQLRNYGYDPLVDQSQTGLGDVVIGAKYLAYRAPRLALAISPRVSLPTGRASDVNKVVDLAPGDGHANIGVAAISDYWLRPHFIWTSSLSYTYQTPMVRAKRIPLEAANWISPDVDQSTHQKAGDIMAAATGLRYEVFQAVSVSASYSFQYKAPDAYSGTHFAAARYGYLSVETEQTMHAVDLGIQYSTVPLFRAHKFEIPLDIGFDYATVLVGRNSKKIELAAIEVASYF